jgi:hypothetical protein
MIYYYQLDDLRPLSEIRREIEDVEKKTDGLLAQILVDVEDRRE